MISLNCLPMTYRVCCWQDCVENLTFGCVFCLSKKKKVYLWRGRTRLEKILVYKTAVKQISTHGDQENVKKYVLLRTLLATWSLLKRMNSGKLQVSGNLVTEKYIELLRPLTFIENESKKKKPTNSEF